MYCFFGRVCLSASKIVGKNQLKQSSPNLHCIDRKWLWDRAVKMRAKLAQNQNRWTKKQEILGAIGQAEAKWGFFCAVNEMTFRQLPTSNFHLIWPRVCILVFSNIFESDYWNVPLRVHLPPPPKKNKLKGINRYLTLIILHPRVCNAEMLFTHFCSPRAVEFQSRVTFLCDITVWTVVQTALTATSILMGIGKFQPPQTRYPWTVTTLIPNLVVAVRLREHLKDYEDHVHCTTYYVPWTA